VAFAYAAAGLRLVADVRLPHLPPSPSPVPDVVVHVGRRPAWAPHLQTNIYTSPHVDARGVPVLRLACGAEGFCFNYADDCLLWADAQGSTVWVTYASTLEDACTYLVGPVLSFVLRLRGDFALHASAVATRSGAVAFAGPHGAGKSTTAAAFGRLGFPIVTDDILRLTPASGVWIAHPVGGILRLWPDAEPLLFGNENCLDPITPNWNKRALSIGSGRIAAAESAVPLAGIVFLMPDIGATSTTLRAVPQAEAAVFLAANSSAAHLIDGVARAREFLQITAIASTIPCVALTRPCPNDPVDHTVSVLKPWMDALGGDTVVSGQSRQHHRRGVMHDAS
jgi:hypothetical protein